MIVHNMLELGERYLGGKRIKRKMMSSDESKNYTYSSWTRVQKVVQNTTLQKAFVKFIILYFNYNLLKDR